MKDDPLPDDGHVARSCTPSRVEDELPLPAAFERKADEEYLSVNWLQYWGQTVPREVALARVRKGLSTRLTLRPNGRLALLNVGAAKNAIDEWIDGGSSITHQPKPGNESHSGVFGFSATDFEVATALANLVGAKDVVAAIVDDT